MRLVSWVALVAGNLVSIVIYATSAVCAVATVVAIVLGAFTLFGDVETAKRTFAIAACFAGMAWALGRLGEAFATVVGAGGRE